MNDNERAEVVQRLLAMQHSLDQSLKWIGMIADAATLGDAPGLAFASHMLKDSLEAWRTAMTTYVRTYLDDD